MMPIRNLLIWGAIALLLVVLFQMVVPQNETRNASERSYSQLLQEVNSGRIKSITTKGETITAKTNDTPAQTIVTYVPSGSMDETIAKLDPTKVDIRTERTQTRRRSAAASATR